jgi:hypothetical protein
VSNTASITPIEIPGKISNLTGLSDQRRIFVKWNKPQDHPELADAYVVSRSDLPAEAETVADTSYEDPRRSTVQNVTYNVTPLRRISEKAVMGVGPESVTIPVTDKKPPRVPTGLEIRESDTGAFLIWDLNTETDLAGYKVFRSDRADSGFRLISDKLVMTNGLFDASYHSGVYYAVSAVDEFGNESAMSAPFRGP